MSNSYKKTPIHAVTCCKSDKKYKTQENKAKRHKLKMLMLKYKYNRTLEIVLPHEKEYGNPWSSGKDGKTYHKKPMHDQPLTYFLGRLYYTPLVKQLKYWFKWMRK